MGETAMGLVPKLNNPPVGKGKDTEKGGSFEGGVNN